MPTVVTRTIGVGRDYANFTTAEADVENIATSAIGGTDLVANDGAIVFEADAGTYSENVTFQSSLTTDATRQVTYKAAAGSEHGGDHAAGVRITGSGNTFNCRDDFLRLEQLAVETTGAFNYALVLQNQGQSAEACIAESVGASCFLLGQVAAGTAPQKLTNSVAICNSTYGVYCVSPGIIQVTNCTVIQSTGTGFRISDSGATLAVDLTNNVVLFDVLRPAYAAFGTPTITGSNNFGGSSNPFPDALQGSPYPITATTSYSQALESGDYAVYMGATGALANVSGNDVWQQGVGPSVNSDVPTTDIKGAKRVGATANPGAFEADGYVAPTVVTKTVGTGKEYTNVLLAEAAIDTIANTEFGGASLTKNNGALVFEIDAGTYVGDVVFSTSSVDDSDATRNVTWTCASGASHNGISRSGVVISTTTCLRGSDHHNTFNGIEFLFTTGGLATYDGTGLTLENCLLTMESGVGFGFFASTESIVNPNRIKNCVIRAEGTSGGDRRGFVLSQNNQIGRMELTNCTGISQDPAFTLFWVQSYGSSRAEYHLVNCLSLCTKSLNDSGDSVSIITGSNNFGGSNKPFPAALQGSPYPITPTTSFSTPLGSGDFAVYMGSNGSLANVSGNDVWQQGVGPDSNADVPTTDINGVARSGATCNPGAFEADGFVAPTVITRTVGTASRDYASLVLAEADVENIGSSGADLTRSNERIEFVCYADSDFSNVAIISDIVADPTRYVWWKAAPGESPRVYRATYVDIPVQDSFTRWTGINAYSNSTTHNGFRIGNNAKHPIVEGMIFEDCEHETNGAIGGGMVGIRNNYAPGSIGTDLFPITYRNLVCKVQSFTGGGGGANLPSFERFLNCTFLGRGVGSNVFNTSRGSGVTADLYEIVNCIILEPNSSDCNIGGGGKNVQGSNNIGNAGAPTSVFTFAHFGIGAQYTPSTAYDPGSGDFALYVGSTGELLNSPNNDVVGQGVGPTANEDVPTTDILGNTRSGATANPGAFELLNTTKTVTRTIGVGQNYETFRDAVNDIENIATSAIGNTNILDYNGAIVFNIVSGQYTDSTDLYIDTSLVTDRTRNVTFKAADGHEHGGKLNAGVIYSITGGTYAFRIRDSHVVLQDIHIKQNLAVNKRGIELDTVNVAKEGGHINRVIITIQGFSGGIQLNRTGWGTAEDPLLITNCYIRNGNLAIFAQNTNPETSDNHVKIINCTSNSRGGDNGDLVYPYAGTGQTLNLTMTNNVVLPNFGNKEGRNMDNSESTGTLNWFGTNNYAVGYSMDADRTFPVAQRGSIYPITPIRNTYNTLSASGDEVVVSFGNGQLVNVPGNAIWNRGSGPDSDSDVPTVDIGGNIRTGTTTNPGAYNTDLVIPSTKTVIEKSVDAGGDGQYTTPALAEADMRNIMVSATGSNDMFEANAQLDISIGGGAYSPFDFGYDRENEANLYSGPENLITFSALNLSDRPRFFGTDIGIRSDFLVVEGFDVNGGVVGNAIKFFAGGTGVKVSRSTLKSGNIVAYVAANGNRGTEEYPVVFENCEFQNTGTTRAECIYAGGGSFDHYLKVINCQANADSATAGLTDSFVRLTSTLNGNITMLNNLNLRNGSSDLEIGFLYAGGDFSLSGSNNVGVSDSAFFTRFSTYGLGNIQASATTSLFPPTNILHSIYEASSNKLVDSTRNDAWKQGIGPSLNSEIDVFDIEGRTRVVYDGLTLTGYDRVNPGAYEVDTDFWTPPTAPATGPTDGPGAFPDLPLQVNFVGDASTLNTSWTEEDGDSRSRRYPTREGDVREKIFKMTQAKSNISFIYKESLRSMIASFNDIGYFNSEDAFVGIKCIHGNAERTIAKLKQENSIILPIVSISQTISDNDDQRRRYESVLVHEKYWDSDKHRAVRVISLAPRPVNIKYQVNIWCKYMADMDQILEQIRLKFNPEMDVPTTYSTLAKASVDSEEAVGSMSAKDKEDRIIKKTLNVTLKTYIPSPKFTITSTGEIEELNLLKD